MSSEPVLTVEALGKRYRLGAARHDSLRDQITHAVRSLGGRQRGAVRAADQLLWALRGVNFEVARGEVLGVIGGNGAGKSTLLKILSRITTPSEGRATMRGRVASLLEVGTGFHPELTGRENVFLNGMLLGMPRRQVERVFDEIVDFAGVETYIDTPIKRYSSGMQLRLAFAVAAHLAADVIIVDEVLAVGDAEFQEKCARTMRASTDRGRTTLFVSHNMAAIESLCSRAILLERGVVAAAGPVHNVVHQYLSGTNASRADAEFVAVHADPSRAAQIRRVQAHSASGGAPVQGGELDIVLDLEVRKPIRRVQCMIWLTTAESSPVCGLSNGDYRQEWDLSPGSYRITIRVPELRLLPRTYVATVQIVSGWGLERFDEVREAVRFHVQSRDVLGTGIALLEDRGVV